MNNVEQQVSLKTFILMILSGIIGFVITAYVFKETYIYEPQPPPSIHIKTQDSLLSVDVVRKDTLFNISNTQATDNHSITVSTEEILFNRNPSFLLWSALFVIMMTVSFGIFPLTFQQLQSLRKIFSVSGKTMTITFMAVIIMMVILFGITSQSSGYYSPKAIMENLKILFDPADVANIMVVITMILMIPQVMSIVLIGIIASRIRYGVKRRALSNAVLQYDILDRYMRSSVIFTLIILVFSVLTSSTLRRSINAVVEINGFNLFPAEAVYVYGLFQSCFVAILYIPAYLSLRQAGHSLHAVIMDYPGKTNDNGEWKDRLLTRMRIPTFTMGTIELLLGVLAPVIGSVIPDLI